MGLFLASSIAHLFAVFPITWLANVIKRPPIWGMSLDQMRTMKKGFRIDGSKAEQELGIAYTHVRIAIEEAIKSYQANFLTS